MSFKRKVNNSPRQERADWEPPSAPFYVFFHGISIYSVYFVQNLLEGYKTKVVKNRPVYVRMVVLTRIKDEAINETSE
jgi:choline-glycine betaine transporter